MKIIKTYEVFKKWFAKPTKKIITSEDNENIDSFLDDIKDISIGYEKFIFTYQNIYLFAIKNYDSKKEEINIFIEEIKSACKSIGINVFVELNFYSKLKNSEIIINYIFLEFTFNEINATGSMFYNDLIIRLMYSLRIPIGNIYF